MNVADVHLLFVQLCFVEVLTGAVGGLVMIEDKNNHERERREKGKGDYKNCRESGRCKWGHNLKVTDCFMAAAEQQYLSAAG